MLHTRERQGRFANHGKQWADFLLQAECKTNGDRLNSGVFFRCRPNEYQQGYEAQIQNGFGTQGLHDRNLRSQTHESVSKNKVKYDRYDYGTGAIYRRIPARMQACQGQRMVRR